MPVVISPGDAVLRPRRGGMGGTQIFSNERRLGTFLGVQNHEF